MSIEQSETLTVKCKGGSKENLFTVHWLDRSAGPNIIDWRTDLNNNDNNDNNDDNNHNHHNNHNYHNNDNNDNNDNNYGI